MAEKQLTITLSDADASDQYFPKHVTLDRLTATQRAIVDGIRLQCVEDEEALSSGKVVRDEADAIAWLLEQIDAASAPE